jgi:hypothetical protein
LERAIYRLKPDKAPGPDELPNRPIKSAFEVLDKEFTRLAIACLTLGYHPTHFREAITVLLRKPGKPNYSDPAAYRPVALLNTLGKILEAVIVQRLSELAEAHQLLPDTQFGARPNRSAETALLNLSEEAHAAWRRNKREVVTILSLDVSKAFDRVSHPRLLHKLRKRRIPEQLVK